MVTNVGEKGCWEKMTVSDCKMLTQAWCIPPKEALLPKWLGINISWINTDKRFTWPKTCLDKLFSTALQDNFCRSFDFC